MCMVHNTYKQKTGCPQGCPTSANDTSRPEKSSYRWFMSTQPSVASTSAMVGILSNDLIDAVSAIRRDIVDWVCWCG